MYTSKRLTTTFKDLLSLMIYKYLIVKPETNVGVITATLRIFLLPLSSSATPLLDPSTGSMSKRGPRSRRMKSVHAMPLARCASPVQR